jgi:hypothetical protein
MKSTYDMEEKKMSDKQPKIFIGDSVLLPDGTIHEVSDIQYVHDRYQLVGVSGWKHGIGSLVLKFTGTAYMYWKDQASVEKERKDKAESAFEKIKERIEEAINDRDEMGWRYALNDINNIILGWEDAE